MPSFLGSIDNGRILLNVNVSKPQFKEEDQEDAMPFRALLDTGATITSVSKQVVTSLALLPDGWTSVTGVHGTAETPTYTIALHVPISELIDGGNTVTTFSRGRNLDVALLAFQPTEFDVLLGMDILVGFHLTMFGEHFILSN